MLEYFGLSLSGGIFEILENKFFKRDIMDFIMYLIFDLNFLMGFFFMIFIILEYILIYIFFLIILIVIMIYLMILLVCEIVGLCDLLEKGMIVIFFFIIGLLVFCWIFLGYFLLSNLYELLIFFLCSFFIIYMIFKMGNYKNDLSIIIVLSIIFI